METNALVRQHLLEPLEKLVQKLQVDCWCVGTSYVSVPKEDRYAPIGPARATSFFAEFGDMTEYEGLTFEERVVLSSSQPEIQQRRYEEMVNRARAERLDSPDEQVVYIFSHSYTQEVGSGPRGPCRERE
jgi:hypothetical protein